MHRNEEQPLLPQLEKAQAAVKTQGRCALYCTQSCPALCDLVDCSPPGSSIHGNPPGKNTGVGSHALLQGNLPSPGIKPRSPTLQEDSLAAEPQAKPKNTGVGSLSLLQRIFPSQESNPGFPHCRQILYQLSRQESPIFCSAWTATQKFINIQSTL